MIDSSASARATTEACREPGGLGRVLLSPRAHGAVVFALALALRLVFVGVFHPPQRFVFSDMWVYDHRARNLLSGALSAWDTFTPVGYPALLAVVYRLTGESAQAVGVLQALLGAATALLVARLALRCFGRPALALGLGLVVALHVPAVFYAGFLLTETVFSFLVVAAVAALAWSARRGSGLGAHVGHALSGLLLGAGAVVRPNLLLFMPLAPVLIWLGQGRDLRRTLGPSAVALAAFLLPTAAAVQHNSRLLGRASSLGTNGGLNFYLNFAEVRGVRFSDRFGTHRITPIPNLVRYPGDEFEQAVRVPFYDDAHYYGRGLALLRERPARLARGLANLVEASGLGVQGYWPGPDRDRLLSPHRRAFFFVCLAPALIGGALLAARRRWAAPEHLPLVIAAGSVLSNLVSVFFFLGDPRLRVPFDPLYMLLAAAAYVWLAPLAARATSWRARRRAAR